MEVSFQLDPETKFPDFFLVIVGREPAGDGKSNGRARLGLRGNQPLGSRSQQGDAAAQGKLCAIVLVLLEEVS